MTMTPEQHPAPRATRLEWSWVMVLVFPLMMLYVLLTEGFVATRETWRGNV